MTSDGDMTSSAYVYSAIFHVVVFALLYGVAHWHLFDAEVPEDTPIVVQLVNVAPQTRATQVNPTPPKPDKPEQVAQAAPPPKPEPPPAPEPPKPPPPPPPPPPPEPPPPAPKPEPPPEPPKPPEPKPEPRPEPPPPKPAPPKNTKDDAAFDSLLKNLAQRRPAHEAQQIAAVEPKASSQPIAPLGSALTVSEMDLVKQQLENCWNVPVGAQGIETLYAHVRIYMNPDATVRSAEIIDHNNQQFAESALRAALNPQCHQLKLPLDKYNGSSGWNTITLKFTPTGVL